MVTFNYKNESDNPKIELESTMKIEFNPDDLAQDELEKLAEKISHRLNHEFGVTLQTQTPSGDAPQPRVTMYAFGKILVNFIHMADAERNELCTNVASYYQLSPTERDALDLVCVLFCASGMTMQKLREALPAPTSK